MYPGFRTEKSLNQGVVNYQASFRRPVKKQLPGRSLCQQCHARMQGRGENKPNTGFPVQPRGYAYDMQAR